MSLELKGTVVAKLEKVTGEGKNGQWVRQEFVISYKSGNYEKEACFQVWGEEKTKDIVSYLKKGDEVNVHFDYESRRSSDRYFSSGTCWKIDLLKSSPTEQQPKAKDFIVPGNANNQTDDLPF